MGKSKIVIYFESDVLSPMEILDTVLEELAMKRDDWATPMPLRCDPLIEVTDYEALDWKGKELLIAKEMN